MLASRVQFLLAPAAIAALWGCAPAERDATISSATRAGEYARALERSLKLGNATDPEDRDALLARMRVPILALAEGTPEAARADAEYVFDTLRTAGLNDDRTIGAVFLTQEGTQIWKGDPFEQALAYIYVGLLDATNAEWGNLRAAAENSLFQLRDFGRSLGKADRDDALAQRVALVRASAERDVRTQTISERPEDLGLEYTPVPSDFELGYALKIVASRRLGQPEEARESAAALTKIAPHLADLARSLLEGEHNAVLVVSAGVGPDKYAAGPDNAIAMYRPLTPSSSALLSLRLNGETVATAPVVTDVNRLARDLKWNNLEDLRRAKSAIGDLLLAGGAIAIAADGDDDNRAATWAGLAAIVLGAWAKATAVADTRQCDVFPQRFYVVPITLPDRSSPLLLAAPDATLMLPAFPGVPSGDFQLRYVRIPERSERWGEDTRVRFTPDAPAGEESLPSGDALPWILGGRCVRTPTAAVLADYQRAGHLSGYQLQDLIDLYHAEEITIVGVDADASRGRHILEGGRWLYTPRAGTTGWVRLFTRERPAYEPRSERVREAAAAEARVAAGRREPITSSSVESLSSPTPARSAGGDLE